MKELIGKINQEMEDFTLNPQAITEFIEKIEELQQQKSPIVRIICEDDIQVLKLARLVILKLLNADSSQIQITGEDWKQENIDFSLIKFWIDDFELNRIISYKLYALGGHAFFNIVKERDLLRYVYDEINAVINTLRLGTESTEKKDKIFVIDLSEITQERREFDIINSLESFNQFVERDGWRAFWTDGSLRNNRLKNQPEEIGKSQLMAFLKGHGIKFGIQHNTFQEVQEGAGFCDVIHIDHFGTRFVFELKIWRGKASYQTGIKELDSYLSHENLDEGFYIIFDKRTRDKAALKTPITTDSGKVIHIIQIDIAQIAPTNQSSS